MVYIGIDPGKSGGIAYINHLGQVTVTPYDDAELVVLCKAMNASPVVQCVCCLEQVHAFPGQSAQSQFNFGQSFGYIRGVMEGFNVPYQMISPQKWKKEFGLNSDKQLSIDVCKRLFPNVSLLASSRCRKDHDGMAEALLMAEYARRKFACQI